MSISSLLRSFHNLMVLLPITFQITRYISGKNRIPKHGQDPLILISCEEDKDIWQDVREACLLRSL